MFKWYRNLKLGTKIIIMGEVMMMIALFSVGILSLGNASDALLKSYKDSLTARASESAEVLGVGLGRVKDSVQGVAEDVSRVLGSSTSLKSVLAEDNENLGYTYLGFMGINNKGLSAEGDVLDFSGLAGYQQALEGEAVVSRSEVSEEDGQVYFHAFAPVKIQDKVIGVVSAVIAYDDINEFIEDEIIGQTGYALVLDETGSVVMHKVMDKVVSKENTLVLAADNPKLAELKNIVQKSINRETGFGEYTYLDGTVNFMSYAPVPDSTWVLLMAVPKAELFADIDNMTYMLIVICVISYIVIFIVVFLFVRSQISRPFKKTAEFAKKLASGELDAKIVIRSKDEIGQLLTLLDGEIRQAFLAVESSRTVTEKQSRYQGQHVDKLILNLERLSKGELYCDMAVAEPDDDTAGLYELYGRISDNLHLTVNTLKMYIEEISQTLGAISAGDLNVNINSEYRGDFTALKASINSIAQSLSSVLVEINTAAEQVASGTRQVSDGSQEISQGATEQASSIEELTAMVTQIAERTKKNALSADKANELTLSAKDDAGRGNEQMKAMQKAMAEINEASENISKIIKVIDDIAFQTNILALNAAVEAARAGIHGKGFAVVAEEVRNLAARSANAAKETTDLIEGSIKKAEVGTKIADETAGALASIVKSVDMAAQLVGEIAAASNEQASAIAQVNGGIEQMSQVVQTNSATSEEAAASAEELSSQAEMLKAMVGRFKLKGDQYSPSARQETKEISREVKPRIDLSDSEFGKY